MAEVAAFASAGAEAYKAHQLHKNKLLEAQAFRDAKNRTMAATTREMAEGERTKELMHSRAIALAAASGAGVDDPGMVKILGDLNAEGEYRIMSQLWSGQNEAEGQIFRAEAAQREADDAYTAGVINVITAGTSAYFGAGGGKGKFNLPTKTTTKPAGVPA
jgi:hypothetical protein